MTGKERGPAPVWAWIASLCALSLALVVGAYAYFKSEEARIQKNWYQEIATVAELKVGQIQRWRKERLEDAERASANPFFRDAIVQWLASRSAGGAADVRRWLLQELNEETYDDALLLDPSGAILASVRDRPDPLDDSVRAAIALSLKTGHVELGDLYRNARGAAHIDVTAPIRDAENLTIALIVLRSGAEPYLYPMIQTWPSPSPTAETLLVRRDGDEVVFINELRHIGGAAFTMRFPLSRIDVPAVSAVRGARGMFIGNDYRGVRVLADLRAVPDTPWFMVAKVDESEILPEARYRAVVIWGAMSMLILLAAVATAYEFRRRQAAVYRSLYSAERDRREAQEELRAVSERQKALLAAVPDIVMEVDKNRVYRWANKAGIEFFGPDVIGCEASQYFAGEQKTYDVVKPIFEGSDMTVYVESWQRRKDGEKRLLSWTSRVLKDERGEVIGALSSARDITEQVLAEERRAKLEEQLRQSRKMEAVGRLAGGVAHDFNNMLSVILGYTEMAIEELPLTDPLYPALGEIKKAARHSADLTRQLLAFARKQPIAPKILDVNSHIEQTRNMLRRLIGDDISLAFFPSDEGLTVKMDPSQMEQILTNLAANSRDSIQGVGSVRIETSKVFLDRAYCDEHVGITPGEYVLITFSDSGKGMDKETLERAFEPFFTTKGVGEGTGLGLATVYGIVTQNGGTINVYSEPDHGTTFRIYLPSTGEKPSGADRAASPALGGTETILVVEDEEQILRMCRTLLESKGYTVLTAGRPGEALEIVKSHEGRIDLLVTDVIMSEMNGKDLKEKIKEIIPGIHVVFMSGYTADIIAGRGVLEKDVRFLQKPFSPTDLARKVREVLDIA